VTFAVILFQLSRIYQRIDFIPLFLVLNLIPQALIVLNK